MDIDIDQLRELFSAIQEFDVQEVTVENGRDKLRVRRGISGAPVASATVAAVAPTPVAAGAAPVAVASSVEEDDPDALYITSPFVGTFYRAPSPDKPPFVDSNQTIEAGQPLCIVEAMKLMNEIEAEFRCTIVDILAENGKTVEYGDRLFKVKKS